MYTPWATKEQLQHFRIRLEAKLLHTVVVKGIQFLQKVRMRLDRLAMQEMELDESNNVDTLKSS